MPARARKEIFDRHEVGVYHCYSRCVRRGFLCGVDELTGNDYSYRMDWIEERVQELQSIFMIDVFATAYLDNHFHTLIRNRPDLVARASDKEIARRSLLCCPKRRDENGKPAKPTSQEIDEFLNTPGKIELWRERLSCISWYMSCIKHPIACRANAEDGVTGHFWESRFHSVRLLDEMAVLMCSVYIDLNELRAGKATTLETSKRSSIYHRIQAWNLHRLAQGRSTDARCWAEPEAWDEEPAPAWLSPINESSRAGPQEGTMTPDGDSLGQHRPSHTGFLPTTLTQYFQLCDWVASNAQREHHKAIPAPLAPIMQRLTSNLDAFLHAVTNFGKLFRWFCGSPDTIRNARRAKGATRIHGVRQAQAVYPAT